MKKKSMQKSISESSWATATEDHTGSHEARKLRLDFTQESEL